VVSPLAVVGAVMGAVGLVVGLPFAPVGLVWGPMLATGLAYTVIAAPAATVGAAVGAAQGMSAPPTVLAR
jgi:hypothetical protein